MDVFTAVADPTRRRIIELVYAADLSAGQIADEFDMSRPAVSKHLRLLREAGIVVGRRIAQQRIYSINPHALDELEDWAATTRSFWATRLANLDHHLENSDE